MSVPLLPAVEAHFQRLQNITAHAGTLRDEPLGAVVQPIYTSSTFRHAPEGSLLPSGYQYSRGDNPNRRELERVLTALEQGAETLCFASGAAAIQAALLSLRPGDHVLVHHNLYMGTRRLLDQLFVPWGLCVTYADLRDLAGAPGLFRHTTRLVWAETPSNPLLEGVDIAGLAGIAHAHGAELVVDSTFATPVGQAPLALGADIVMHATTKYLAGHSDLTGGSLTLARSGTRSERIQQIQHLGGAVPAPFDCYQTLRGIRSLVPRYRQQCATAQQVALALVEHPSVLRVNYPGMPSHPDYPLFQRQQYLPGAMLSVHIRGGAAAAYHVLGACRVWTVATSLGGTESLAEHRASTEGEGSPTPADLIRLSVGLESPEALIADLWQALDTLR